MAATLSYMPPALPDPGELFDKSQTIGGGGEDPKKPNNEQPEKGHLAEEPVRCPKCGNRHKGECDMGFCDKCNRNHRLPCHYCHKCGKRGNHTAGQCRKTGKGGKVQKAPKRVARPPQITTTAGSHIFNMGDMGAEGAYALGKALSFIGSYQGGRGGRGGRGRGRGRGGRGRGRGGRGRGRGGRGSSSNNDNKGDQGDKGPDETEERKSPRTDMDQS